mmetsp:Transcript_819/g.1420  ORF Transcript_819/g.1420 Transcript_819/m.1420 type:complete len:700 (-) Transcript_819:1156-3255(-)
MQKNNGQGTGLANITVETRTDGTTVASELFATYPLRLHLTKLPDHKDENGSSLPKALNCYILGYGGGMISGDVNELNINVKPHSKLVVTSQSTSKAFKAISGRRATCVRTRAKVARSGLLFLVPQPMQCFGGSKLTLSTDVTLEGLGCDESFSEDDDPSLLLVDWYTGGRENLDGGRWQLSSFHSRTTVSICESAIFSDDEAASKPLNGIGTEKSKLVFRDATRLSGGMELQKHMRNYNIICMVTLLGPKLKEVASKFLATYSSRRAYDEKEDGGEEDYKTPTSSSKTMDYNQGEGLNRQDEGLLVSCGTFQTCKEGRFQTGVVVRLAATTLEKAASFLSKHIGTLGGHLEDDPFMEILVSKQGVGETRTNVARMSQLEPSKERFSLGLMANSYQMSPNSIKDPSMSSKTPGDCLKNGMNPLTLFQLVDSCVPSGGFAHSNTLEAAHQLHLLDSSGRSWTCALSNHIWEVLLNTVTSVTPFLIASCQLFRNHYHQDGKGEHSQTNSILMKEWEKLDALLRASTTSHVASRASATQGSGMLRAFSSSFHEIAPILKSLKRCTLKVHKSLADCTGHGATSFGAVCGLLNIDDKTCCSMYLYTVLRDMVNAAVRMNLVGPLEGGRLIHDLSVAVERLIETELPRVLCCVDNSNGGDNDMHHVVQNGQISTKALDVECAHQICPIIEILSNAHDRLYTRLFNS